MVKYILKKLNMELDGADYTDFVRSIAIKAKEQKKIKDTMLFYYPVDTNEKEKLEFIAEGKIVNKEVSLTNFYIHHTSSEVWKGNLENYADNVFVLKNGEKEVMLSLVNKDEAKEKENNIEVSAFGHSINIYKTEEEYIASLKETNGIILENGAILPLIYLNRMLENLEQNNMDRIVTVRGQIISLKQQNINIYGIDAGDYILATVKTNFGNLPVYFKYSSIEGKMPESIKEGDILVGNISITGKVRD